MIVKFLNKIIHKTNRGYKNKFITQQITSWNNFSYENLEYDNLLYKNIVIYYDGQIDYQININIYETISDNEIRKVATLELLPDYND